MAELNEEQLLLLSNLMYYHADGSGNSGSVEDICRDILAGSDSELKGRLSGGFESDIDNMRTIAKAVMDDPQLSSLQVADTVDKNSVYATCFVDSNGEATVAVRGTGGSYKAWKDNVLGAYDDDTLCQETMLEFANKLKDKGYSDITITGHSKGGNMAQYVTLLSGDLVDRCISFDGQGFNDHFVDKYADEIAENGGKIKSICAKNDYVSILLNTVAGETVYLENDVNNFKDGHSPFTLWKTNKGDLKYGQYATPVDQDPTMAEAEVLLDKLCNDINHMPKFLRSAMVDNLGSIAGLIFGISSHQFSWDDFLDMCLDLFKLNPVKRLALKVWLIKELAALAIYIGNGSMEEEIERRRQQYHNTGHVPVEFSVNCQALNSAVEQLDGIMEPLAGMVCSIETIHLDGLLLSSARREVKSIKNRISDHMKGIMMMERVLQKVSKRYEQCETGIVEVAGH